MYFFDEFGPFLTSPLEMVNKEYTKFFQMDVKGRTRGTTQSI